MLVEHIDSILKKRLTLIKAKHDQFDDHSYKQTLHPMSYIQAVVYCTEERKREKKDQKKKDCRCNAWTLNLSGVKEKFTILLNYYSEQDPNKSSNFSLQQTTSAGGGYVLTGETHENLTKLEINLVELKWALFTDLFRTCSWPRS